MLIIEPFESRHLLSAVLNGNILTIHVTATNDTIQVWNNASDSTQLVVNINGSESSFGRYRLKLIRIYGGKGDDVISALPMNEPVAVRMSVDAGAGNDSITGGAGDDTVIGNMGNDTINGGGGANFIDYRYVHVPTQFPSGSPITGVVINLPAGRVSEPSGFTDTLGDDIQGVLASVYVDTITGTNGNDTLLGFGGKDIIHGGAGDDFIRGGSGKDTLFGDSGNDTILGDVGNDHLNGGDGNDSLRGGNEESDTFTQADFNAGHVMDFQPGLDTLE